ncbi:MAG: glutaminyl-peptide cyclotransferase [Gammaproteobacteria bacterium]|nr:glutaminyl-peptide cyclotransferase [Gammaproteobacteria bacterium]
MRQLIGACAWAVAALQLISPAAASERAPVPGAGFRVVAEYPHDASAFTQGLVFHRGFLYESTGRYGESTVRKVELETGRVLNVRKLPADRFGEGLTVAGERLIQLTWRARTGYVYDLDTLNLVGSFHYPTEGWGLAYDGTHLLLSDGSDAIHLLDPETFGLVGSLRVHHHGKPVTMLNELEFVDGFIYANVWQSTRVARIDAKSGQVVAWIEFAALAPPPDTGAGVLNGIAYHPGKEAFLITGKLWPTLYMINLIQE